MTLEELGRIVCSCIAKVGIAPVDWEKSCASTLIGELKLTDDAKVTVCRCVLETLQERGCTGTCGPGNFPDHATVQQAADTLATQITCR
jgi:hypothetical protein